jgi:serine/threonine protein kinase/Tol biopolymer transport system component
MALTCGIRLGPYEIVSPLGAGGMGEVYRARDTRLERHVAIKVLPADLSSDPSLRQRLEREAKAVSNLSHPNICALHDIGHQEGMDFLVMELLEGETLEHRLIKGPLPPEQTLRLAGQIADALAKAHKVGITHRDLKPANIMVTKAGAKLMDFGLAKQAGPAPLADALTEMTVEQSKLTTEGSIVGTFQYMAPEQLEGKEADARTDIFALGEVMYEMATGKPVFSGKSRASLIAAILTTEPPSIRQSQPLTPPAVERVVKKCLAKDPDERWQSASDLASELKWIAESGSQTELAVGALVQRKVWDRVSKPLASLLVLLLFGGGAAWWVRARQIPPVMHFNSPVPFAANDVALSPDGRVLALVAYSDQSNKYVIWTHEVGSRAQTAVPGTEGASHPFWSPDGRFIGFFANGKLKKVDVSGGSAQVLCDAPSGRGGTWNREGTILFSPNGNGGLYRVPSTGGTPMEVTKPDMSRPESSHRWPAFLPDGRHFLYLGANFTGEFEKNTIFIGSLDSGEKRAIVSASSNAAYADPGYLLYMRDNALVAQRFDSSSYKLSGEPRTISDEVRYLPSIDIALFDVAGRRTLVAQTGKTAKSQLTWFDRNGKSMGTVGSTGSLGAFANPSLSPDQRRMAVDQFDLGGRIRDIWIHELASDAVARFTFGPSYNAVAIWSPDGTRIVFASNRKLYNRIYQKKADGSGPEELIVDLGLVGDQYCWDWSHDGKYLLAHKGPELWSVSLPDRQAKPFIQAKWSVRNARFSPDGRWVAYASNETGIWEVYVSPFPTATSKWQVSRGGGEQPRWRRDGKELFFLSGEGKMTVVAVKTGSTFEAGPPVTLFQTHTAQPISTQDVFSYDVSGDGQKFLINTRVDEPNAAPLSIILNWASEMER